MISNLNENAIKLKQLVFEIGRETNIKLGDQSNLDTAFKPSFRGKYNHGVTQERGNQTL